MRIASLSPFLNEERQEISAIDTEGRETVFVRFGRRKPRLTLYLQLQLQSILLPGELRNSLIRSSDGRL